MPQRTPIVLISPEARAALIAQAHQSGATSDITGGLLFGYPVQEQQHLVVSSVRLSSDVGFGRRDFSLDQTRTSRELEQAQRLGSNATYYGVWYLHRTPDRELSNEEWLQAQTVLEDPDLAFDEAICLVLCLYSGQENLHAFCLNRYQSARGQAPSPAALRLTTDSSPVAMSAAPSVASGPTLDWYKNPETAARLGKEHTLLAARYTVEAAVAPDAQMYFRMSPRHKYQRMSFYLAVGGGFPDKAPHVLLLIGGKPQRIATPILGSWSAKRWLVELADELVEWLAFSIDSYIGAAEEAFARNSYNEAADLLRLVLAIEPRTPKAARSLAKAEAMLGVEARAYAGREQPAYA